MGALGARAGSWLRTRVLIGLVAGGVAWLFHLGPAGWAIEQKGLDLLFLLRGAVAGLDDLLIVAIDEPSFAELGLQWPWPRRVHARLVDHLKAAGARVIALDILFAEPSVPADDAALAAALRRAGNVVLASTIQVVESPLAQQRLHVPPLPALERAAAAVGVTTLQPERDAVIRVARPSLGGVPTFAGAVARLAGWRGDGPAGSFLINYLGPSPAIRTVSYVQALTPGDLPEATFRGKIVMVGRAVGPSPEPNQLVPDGYLTPFFAVGRRLTPGVEIHATAVDTLLQGKAVEPVGAGQGLLWIVGWSLAAALLLGGLSPWLGVAAAFVVAGTEGGVALAAFAGGRVWLPWVAAVGAVGVVYGATLAGRWYGAEREKAFIRRAFQHYVHPAVVREILGHPEKLRLGGESVESTVLMSDLQGFARIAEGFTPEALVAFLNEYLSAMIEVILAHRGMLNQTIGDGVLALWGVPIPNATHALDACRAALAMQRRLASLNRGWAAAGRPSLRMRIGLQTGEIVVGNIGSPERFNYAAVGDNVNLASRLEGINKLYGTGIILGEDTARRVADVLVVRELDRIRVVGREDPVRVYECVGERAELLEARSALLGAFGAGLVAYQRRAWGEALGHFERAVALSPEDGPSGAYLERAQRFLIEPPPEDWDGVYTALSKEG